MKDDKYAILWMGFIYLSSHAAHSSWNFIWGLWQETRLPVKYSWVSWDAALPVAMFKRQAYVDAGNEKGSHDYVTALRRHPFGNCLSQFCLPVTTLLAALLFLIQLYAVVPSQTFHVGSMWCTIFLLHCANIETLQYLSLVILLLYWQSVPMSSWSWKTPFRASYGKGPWLEHHLTLRGILR